MNKSRRHFSAPEKVAILRRHLLDKTPVSDLCDEVGIAPNLFYRWQKEFFENGHAMPLGTCAVRQRMAPLRPGSRVLPGSPNLPGESRSIHFQLLSRRQTIALDPKSAFGCRF